MPPIRRSVADRLRKKHLARLGEVAAAMLGEGGKVFWFADASGKSHAFSALASPSSEQQSKRSACGTMGISDAGWIWVTRTPRHAWCPDCLVALAKGWTP